jgi:hypothetical protein
VAGGAFAPEGHATRECDGLEVCIRVPGPWVAIPAPTRTARAPSVTYQLSCPRGSVAGGLDAVLGERTIDVTFLGGLGSPVNPGITTSRAVVFVATYTGVARRPTTFQPRLGCIPTSGGGGRRTTAVGPGAPVSPLTRRARTFRFGSSARLTGSVSCTARERLLGSSHTVAFRTRARPTASVLASVRVTRTERGRRVVVSARRGFAAVSARPEVQVLALCGRRG